MRKGKIQLITLCLLAILIAPACSPTRLTPRQRQLERTKEERKKEAMQQYEQAVKRHQGIQTKETRKRLKQNEREARRKQRGRKTFFLKRWFNKGCH